VSWTVYLPSVTLGELRKLPIPQDLEGQARDQAKQAKRIAVSLVDTEKVGPKDGRFNVSIDCRCPDPDAQVPEYAAQIGPAVTVSVARDLVSVG
jgi:hypothetical protein